MMVSDSNSDCPASAVSALKFNNVIHKINHNQSRILSRLISNHPVMLEIDNAPTVKPINRYRSYKVILKLVKQTQLIKGTDVSKKRNTICEQVKFSSSFKDNRLREYISRPS